MSRKFLLLSAVLILALTSACTFTVNVPTVTTGETQTLTVNEAYPTGNARVEIEMGAGDLALSGGADGLLSGTVRYNVSDWKPGITRTGDLVRISQIGQNNIGLPGGNVINEWNLKLGSKPVDLTVKAGAYRGTLDLGGLALTNLEISDGASEAKVTFDKPNPVKMDRLTYKSGASKVELTGLSNANFQSMRFEGGAGSYTLDFSGVLRQDTTVQVTTGMSNLRILVPAGLNVEVKVTGGINNVSTTGSWSVNGSTYTNPTSGPKLTIQVEMGVGNLELIKQ
jgi:hypothetical protein